MLEGAVMGDMVVIIGSIDPVLGKAHKEEIYVHLQIVERRV